jgi:hypothetical protein
MRDAKRSNDRVLKACHAVFIKLSEIGHLGFIRLDTHGSPDDKKQNSGQNRKSFDKNVLSRGQTVFSGPGKLLQEMAQHSQGACN